jgi:hypothetical protein
MAMRIREYSRKRSMARQSSAARATRRLAGPTCAMCTRAASLTLTGVGQWPKRSRSEQAAPCRHWPSLCCSIPLKRLALVYLAEQMST